MQAAGVSKVDTDVVAPFRFRVLDGRYLITNDFGDWLLLDPRDFKAFVEGDLEERGDLRDRLASARFLRSALDVAEAAEKVHQRADFLDFGPDRHVLVCEAPDGSVMSGPTAEKAIDCAFMSTSPSLRFVLRGGDPLAQPALLDHVAGYAVDKNRLSRKQLDLVVETDLGGMDDAVLRRLVEGDIAVHVLLTDALLDDGAAPARTWIDRLHAAWRDAGSDRRVRLLVDLTAARLDRARDIVDLVVDLGCSSLDLRRPHDRRLLLGDEGAPGFSVEAWTEAWCAAFDRIVERAAEGHTVYERTARVLAAKILDAQVPHGDDDYRSPARDGIGELAYHWDGRVFASDAGRELADLGDDQLFHIGQVPYQGYHDLITSPTVRALVLASTLESQPGWESCAYKPFVGLCPAENYAEQGSIHGRMVDGSGARVLLGILDHLFLRLTGDDDARATLERWVEDLGGD